MSDPRAKILVVDDSAAGRDVARSALESAGYTVVLAEDGQRALEVALSEKPDVVLLDVVMPRLNGLEACRILKAKARAANRYTPIVMLSTRNSANARVEGLKSGADDYLGKPYDAEELVVRVAGLLRNRDTWAAAGSATPEHADEDSDPEPFRRRLHREFDRARRYEDPLACLCVRLDLDVDPEKRSGVPSGSPSLDTIKASRHALRRSIERTVRQIDLVFGDDDGHAQLVLLPNTHFPGALAVAERIVAAHRTSGVDGERVPISVGISFYPHADAQAADDLFNLASRSAQRAHEEGGGRICLAQHEGYVYAPEA